MKSIITKTLLVLAISGLPFICDAQCENNTIKDLAKGGVNQRLLLKPAICPLKKYLLQ